MIGDPINVPFDPPDPDLTYRNYLEMCEMLGVEQVPRESRAGLMADCRKRLQCFDRSCQRPIRVATR